MLMTSSRHKAEKIISRSLNLHKFSHAVYFTLFMCVSHHHITLGNLLRTPIDLNWFSLASRGFSSFRYFADSASHLIAHRGLDATIDDLNEVIEFIDVALVVAGRK